ncbi:helix-turn-helix domain-containing protein [Blastomonas fulva]|jgi:AraC-like DNA-binding protein|uniref:AraC family transcriptional regulator n=1 Tax=Blastomonas fulva TaxID=1550728 RepID=UPI003D2DE9DB
MARFLGTADLDLLEAIFEGLPDCPFFVKDSGLRYIAANPAMLRLIRRRSLGDIIGLRASDLFPDHLAARYEALDRQLLATGQPIHDRLEQTVDGIWLLFARIPVRDRNGACVGLIATAQRMRAGDPAHIVYQRLAQSAEMLEDRFDQPLALRHLAELARISPSQLERDFQRSFGMTPSTFLHKRRIEHAIGLLARGLSITEIAHRCGYADHSAFTRRFRSVTGLAPTAYRTAMNDKRVKSG